MTVTLARSSAFKQAIYTFILWSLFIGNAFSTPLDIPTSSVPFSQKHFFGVAWAESEHVEERWRVAQVDSRTSVEIKMKSPLAAGVLGGVLGYGSGQYYSKKWISGTTFLILDGLLTALLVDALASELEYESRAETFGEVFGEAAAAGIAFGISKTYSLGLAVGGLVATHVAQAIWGPLSAHRYNKKMQLVGEGTGPYVVGSDGGVQVGFAYCF